METLILLSHKKSDGHINIKIEFGEGEGKVPLDNIATRDEVYKPKERVTYKMTKECIEAKYGFKVHTAYIAEVKRSLGLSRRIEITEEKSDSGESGSYKGCVEAFCGDLIMMNVSFKIMVRFSLIYWRSNI